MDNNCIRWMTMSDFRRDCRRVHNFTAAAKRSVAVEADFVSRRVMALEEALGVPLLVREKRTQTGCHRVKPGIL